MDTFNGLQPLLGNHFWSMFHSGYYLLTLNLYILICVCIFIYISPGLLSPVEPVLKFQLTSNSSFQKKKKASSSVLLSSFFYGTPMKKAQEPNQQPQQHTAMPWVADDHRSIEACGSTTLSQQGQVCFLFGSLMKRPSSQSLRSDPVQSSQSSEAIGRSGG